MTDMITAEQAQKLLYREGDYTDQSLDCASEAIARTVIALYAENERLQAEVNKEQDFIAALMVERCAQECNAFAERADEAANIHSYNAAIRLASRIRALADQDALAEVQQLRADVKGWAENATEAWRLMREAEDDRDTLAADNARLAVAGVLVVAADIAKRCVYQYADPGPQILALSTAEALAEVQQLRAERDTADAKLDRLTAAAKALQADMLERAEFGMDAISGEKYRIVNAGSGAWDAFCAALEGK